MIDNSPSSEINISKRGVGFQFYQEQLKLFWIEVKRSAIYEYDTIHGVNCICCQKIRLLEIGNDTKPKSKMGWKPGGHNQK
jgi:hypothetical protein